LQSKAKHHQNLVLGPQWILSMAEKAGKAHIQMANVQERCSISAKKTAYLASGWIGLV
jgi:hypothetical protein